MRNSQESLAGIFGENVFSDAIQRLRLPGSIYEKLRASIRDSMPLSADVAEVVAVAMKEWAVEKGATHFTHWFQPMTDVSAEKHNSFISPDGAGSGLLEFAGKELAHGEADGSAFPSGGLRSTFEARGYTNWDCTSPAFIREDPGGVIALNIPTSFYSYNGEALDTRTPLLRSMQALDKQALRVLRLFGNTTAGHVNATVGAEQEYFLIDRKMYKQREDVIYTGRTLLGAPPPKGQEMDDQYYTHIRQRVSEFMADLNEELWKLGVAAKTQHNESAPAQHELAVVYQNANIASDHNQLVMLMLRKVASRHSLACLLHEKPFSGVSGSGKHNNWSLATDDGVNLLSPGKTKSDQFWLFFLAVIAAANDYADLIRVTGASYSNDMRLGGHEAPPPILSVFIGDEMFRALKAAVQGREIDDIEEAVRPGLPHMVDMNKDNTDRNRTSPFAFTGDKFELRIVGSSQSVATVNTILNTIVAEELRKIADDLESSTGDFDDALRELLSRLFEENKRIIFNGNNYDESWMIEAEKRGLPMIKTAVDAFGALVSEKNMALFEKHHIYTPAELESRLAIRYDRYIKTMRIEARTLLDMARQQILPCALRYQKILAGQVSALLNIGRDALVPDAQLDKISGFIDSLHEAISELHDAVYSLDREATEDCAREWQEKVVPLMADLRKAADALEILCPRDLWPLPTYADMLLFV